MLARELPTPLPFVNLVLVAASAFALAVAAGWARRWSWAWLAGASVLVAAPSLAVVPGGAAVVVAILGRRPRRRSPFAGLAVGLLGYVALLTAPPRGPTGLSTALALVAAGPVLASAYRLAARPVRRQVAFSLVALTLCVVAAGAMALVGLRTAVAAAQRSETAARAATRAAGAGDRDEAGRSLDAAAGHLLTARHALRVWWMAPARAVPVLGHQIAVLDDVSTTTAAVAEAAGSAVGTEGWTIESGQVDLAAVERLASRLDAVLARLGVARATLASSRSGWVAPPLATHLERLDAALAELDPPARRAARLAHVLPELLGGHGTRTYVALFGTPAEARELGGLIASALVLRVDAGRVEVVRAQSNGELNELLAAAGVSGEHAVSQDWSASPDYPTAAAIVAGVFPGEARVDGVLYLDPFAVEALLELTGPVVVASAGLTMDAEHVVSFLLRGQYEHFAAQAERKDFLGDLATAAFEQLLRSDVDPGRLVTAVAPVAEAGRFRVWSSEPAVQDVLADLGVDGAYPRPSGGDLLGVGYVNTGSNKLDAYLHRTIAYEVALDPATGALEAALVVQLANKAPADLAPYILGLRPSPHPPATNVADLVVRTPHRLVQATVDGEAVAPSATGGESELGSHRYRIPVVIPRGSTVEVRVELAGQVTLTEGYTLHLVAQPLANPDLVVVVVGTPARARRTVVEWVDLPSEQAFRLHHDLTLRARLATER